LVAAGSASSPKAFDLIVAFGVTFDAGSVLVDGIECGQILEDRAVVGA
jgi:hypothetical protein